MFLGAAIGWGDLTYWATVWIWFGWVFAFTWHVLMWGTLAVFTYVREWIIR